MLRIRSLAIALAAGGILAAAPASAQVESKCLSGKLKGAGGAAAAQVNCEAKAAAKGVAVDPECVTKSQAKLTKAFEKAENKDDCIATGDAAVAQTVVDDFVAELAATLNPPPVICCAAAGACLYTADATACAAIPGAAPGADGTVCTGTGACAPPPAAAGPCCQDFVTSGMPIGCANGTFDATGCGLAGGTFSTAICSPSGQCL
jgi:hypothetical protein